jgi:predicted transcriptional regulator
MVGVRLGPALTAKIDAWAKANKMSRSEAMREAIARLTTRPDR